MMCLMQLRNPLAGFINSVGSEIGEISWKMKVPSKCLQFRYQSVPTYWRKLSLFLFNAHTERRLPPARCFSIYTLNCTTILSTSKCSKSFRNQTRKRDILISSRKTKKTPAKLEFQIIDSWRSNIERIFRLKTLVIFWAKTWSCS